MKILHAGLLSVAWLLLVSGPLNAQESTVYATVVATKLFVVGAANPRTGLYFQRPIEDTVWHHAGPVNIRAFGTAVPTLTRGKVLYIAAGNGVHKSTDGGATWRITTDWRITEVLCVATDPTDLNTVYVATPYGVFRTTDGCATWTEANSGLGALFTSWVVVDHSDSRKVYCATEEGVFASDDRGIHWKRFGLSVAGTRIVVQHPRDPLTLIAGTEDYGLYVTRNGGKWWTKCEAGLDHQTFYAVAFDPNAPDTVYAGGYVTGVYKSTDGARSWKRMNTGLTVLTIHSLAVDPVKSERVYAAAYWGGVFRSDNGGGNWRNVGHPESQVYTIVVEPF